MQWSRFPTALRHQMRRMILLLPVFTMACLNDTLAPPAEVTNRGNILGFMSTWPSAATIALDSTQQLVVTATSLDGAPLPEAVSTFTSSNDTIVSVDTNGLLTALRVVPYTTVFITVRTMYRSATRFDTVYVRVTPTTQNAARLSLQPLTEAERHLKVGGNLLPNARVFASDNITLVPDILVSYEIADLLSGANGFGTPIVFINFNKRGTVWIRGSTVAYGKELIDSTRYEITDQDSTNITIYNFSGNDQTYNLTSLYLAQSGKFTVTNYTTRPLTITFSDLTMVTGGNMTVGPYATELRVLPKAGKVIWSADTSPAIGGTIVVR